MPNPDRRASSESPPARAATRRAHLPVRCLADTGASLRHSRRLYAQHMAEAHEIEFVFERQDEGGCHVYAPTCRDSTPRARRSTRPLTTRAKRSACTWKASAKKAVRSIPASSGASCRCRREPRGAGHLRRATDPRAGATRLGGRPTARKPCSPAPSRRRTFLVVRLHRELKRGTLVGILRDVGLDVDELRRQL